MSKKRINPRRQPTTLAHVKRAENTAINVATKYACALMLYTLAGKFGLDEQLHDIWAAFNYTADCINEGYLSLNDVLQTLLEEHNIKL